jgi:polysaccharide deacetylase family protein (PEP-CTERM system associated)
VRSSQLAHSEREASSPNGTHVGIRREPIVCVQPPDGGLPRHAFTVDVEDWYQSCIDYDAPITERVVHNVDKVLTVLDESGVKGTFFVQGRVAETFPSLIGTLAAGGHEVQSHGYSHRPLSAMSRKEARTEFERAKKTVEDAAGVEVTGFRAQDFSIVAHNLWALEMLADVGFTVDSSIFPVRTPHYGIAGWPLEPHVISFAGGATILEVPVAIWPVGGVRLPVAGGGYFRLLPRRVLEHALGSIERAGRPAVIYCHPYEFNKAELAEFPALSKWVRASQGVGRRSFGHQMASLLRAKKFGRLRDVLQAWGLR